jgi:hypothetical protein
MGNRKFGYLIIFSAAIGLTMIIAINNFTSGMAAKPGGSITGVVWQDFCRADCAMGSSWVRGDGIVNIYKGEQLLPGIKVLMAKGKCAEKRRASSVKTNSKGFYQFTNLAPGFYCVSVDSRQSRSAFPKPGYWSRPKESKTNPIARYEIKVVGLASYVNTSFGWNTSK